MPPNRQPHTMSGAIPVQSNSVHTHTHCAQQRLAGVLLGPSKGQTHRIPPPHWPGMCILFPAALLPQASKSNSVMLSHVLTHLNLGLSLPKKPPLAAIASFAILRKRFILYLQVVTQHTRLVVLVKAGSKHVQP